MMQSKHMTRRTFLHAAGSACVLLSGSLLSACGAGSGTTAASATSASVTSASTAASSAALATSSSVVASGASSATSSTGTGTAQSATVAAKVSSSTTVAPAEVVGTGATRVEWWQGLAGAPNSPQQKADRPTLDAFIKAHPDISVTYNTAATGDVDEQPVLTRIAAGTPPDIVNAADLLLASWSLTKAIVPLDSYMQRDKFDTSHYWPASRTVIQYAGKTWGMPWTNDVRGLLYNKTLFQNAGLDPAKPPATLSDTKDAGDRITKSQGDTYSQIGFIPWYGQGVWLWGWGWAYGGDFWNATTQKVTANDPKNVAALTYFQQETQRLGLAKVTAFTKAQSQGKQSGPLAGNMGMWIDGNWNSASIKQNAPNFDYGVGPWPLPEGSKASSWSGIWCYVMPQGVKNPDAAWTLLGYLGGADAQLINCEITGDTPARQDASEQLLPKQVAQFGPTVKDFQAIMPVSHHRPTMPAGVQYWNDMGKAVQDVLNGKQQPQQALDQLTTTTQIAVDKAISAGS
jgi:multiple sugar transport system substrate-binding protein